MKISRVYQSDGRYYYVQDLAERNPRTGRPRQKWHPLTRIEEGEAALLAALKELLGAAAPAAGTMPGHLQEFRTATFPALTHDVKREYARMLDVVAEAFQDFDTAQVIPGDIEAFLANFTQHRTAQRAYKARLSTFFSWCVRKNYTAVNPCRELRLKAPPKRKGRMTDAIFWAVHAGLTPVGQCFLELLYCTRQRPTEIRLLREADIGPTHIRFRPTKTEHSSGEEVEILITPEIRAALDRARALRKQDGKVADLARARNPAIIQTRDGDPYSKNGLYELWRDAVDAAEARGIACKGVTTRDVRPYALAAMKRAGYDLDEIQLSAAHAIRSTTEGYLDQHRQRVSDARIGLPERKT